MVRQTSIEAYNQIKDNGLLSQRRWEVYDILYEKGPLTGGEVAIIFREKHKELAGANMNMVTRLGELRNIGVAYEVGTRKCAATGQNVILWDVTDKVPIKFERVKKLKCPHCSGKGFKIEQQGRLF